MGAGVSCAKDTADKASSRWACLFMTICSFLPDQSHARRVIAAMHLGMAVLAAAVHVEHGVRPPGIRLVTLLDVAALAELRAPHGGQRGVIRAGRRVASHAVLPHGRVLPQERTPLLLVALVAFVVDGIGADQFLALGPVRVVTGGAFHPVGAALVPKQVPRPLQHGFANARMAPETGLGFGL